MAKNSCRSFNAAKQIDAAVVSNIKIKSTYYKITLNLNNNGSIIKPGQFFSVKCSGGLSPFLRRPFSVHRIRGQGVGILYKVVGKATEILSEKKQGDTLDVIGPLGNGFDFTPYTIHHTPYTILIGGGHGVAPLVALAERLAYSVERRALSVFLGAQTRKELLCEEDFKAVNAKIYISTEDGSKGYKGLITGLLKRELSAKRYPPNATIYACGPNPMLKEIGRIAAAKKIRAFGSFEEHMACGVGSCYGCAIETKDGYKRVCKDGPVFNLKEIVW